MAADTDGDRVSTNNVGKKVLLITGGAINCQPINQSIDHLERMQYRVIHVSESPVISFLSAQLRCWLKGKKNVVVI